MFLKPCAPLSWKEISMVQNNVDTIYKLPTSQLRQHGGKIGKLEEGEVKERSGGGGRGYWEREGWTGGDRKMGEETGERER